MKGAGAFAILFLTVAATLAVGTTDINSCTNQHIYMELGCTPVHKNNTTSPCADSFNCSNLHPDMTKCYYRGKEYNDKQSVPDGVLRNSCSQSCTCFTSPLMFSCAEVDCFQDMDESKDDCIRTQDLDSCCSTGEVCGKDEINNLPSCVVDGVTYRKGQTFYPENSCKICECNEKWKGDTESDNCIDIDCGVEIHNQGDIALSCAPVYTETNDCCPIYFECPNDNTTIVIKEPKRTVSGASCTFGNETLAVGDTVNVQQKCTKCSCVMPPLVTCLLDTKCDTSVYAKTKF